jgi:hypothetical protein
MSILFILVHYSRGKIFTKYCVQCWVIEFLFSVHFSHTVLVLLIWIRRSVNLYPNFSIPDPGLKVPDLAPHQRGWAFLSQRNCFQALKSMIRVVRPGSGFFHNGFRIPGSATLPKRIFMLLWIFQETCSLQSTSLPVLHCPVMWHMQELRESLKKEEMRSQVVPYFSHFRFQDQFLNL